MELDDLSITDASNTTQFPEGQAPSTLNNGARALQGMIARFVQDINTSVAATLSGSVIQATVNHASITLTGTTSNYRADLLVSFKMGASPNPSPCSLNLDGVGAIALRNNRGGTLSSSVILSGTRALAVKDGDNNYFRLLWPEPGSSFISDEGITDFLDEDDMVSNSATAIASQQSIKAYVDTEVATKTGITLGTEQASTSGTAITFSSIPAGTKRITVNLVGVSTNGTSPVILQLGDSGGVEATGYLGTGANISTAGQAADNYTTGFGCGGSSGTAATGVLHGAFTLTLEDSTNNTWVATFLGGQSDTGSIRLGGGSKSLSAALDRVVLTTSGGTDTFDAGAVNVMYE